MIFSLFILCVYFVLPKICVFVLVATAGINNVSKILSFYSFTLMFINSSLNLLCTAGRWDTFEMLSEPLKEIYGDVHVIQGVVTSTSSLFPGREKEFLLKRGLIDTRTTERSLN